MEALAEALSHPDGKAAVQRLCGARGYHQPVNVGGEGARGHKGSIVGEIAPTSAVALDERRQVNSLGPSEISVRRQIRDYLLFIGKIRGIDALILVVLAEQSYALETWKWIHWWARARRDSRSRREVARPGWSTAECGDGKDGALLYAVGRDRPYLREHILPPVVDAPTRAQH